MVCGFDTEVADGEFVGFGDLVGSFGGMVDGERATVRGIVAFVETHLRIRTGIRWARSEDWFGSFKSVGTTRANLRNSRLYHR